jgi:shikimate kinase/3-dehydroquinate synthase
MIFLYGPPASGKTTLGRLLASLLGMYFVDLDEQISSQAKLSIPDIFSEQGETGFRAREKDALQQVVKRPEQIVALGGGALLDQENRLLAEANGAVVCLSAPFDTLLDRMSSDQGNRPLLDGEKASLLKSLLEQREEHYRSFPIQIQTEKSKPHALVQEIQIQCGRFRVSGMGKPYDVIIAPQSLATLGDELRKRGLAGPVAVVSDRNVAGYHMETALKSLKKAGYDSFRVVLLAGEANKNIKNVEKLWKVWLSHHLERTSTVVALGGGVVGDMAGFAAAAYLRGIAWVVAPTSLLAMADSSLGGKTGVDTPQGKNLVGAFHSPNLVLTDPVTLNTLPVDELHNGMAEIVKAGLIGDARLFEQCAKGWEAVSRDWNSIVRRSAAVKIGIIQKDPFEQNLRAVLNTGHTIGHAIEKATTYRVRHGEAVAIGMVIEARLSVKLGVANPALVDEIIRCLAGLHLPIELPAVMDREVFFAAMQHDKKKTSGKIKFALPVQIGEVKPGVIVDDMNMIQSLI